MPAMTLNDGSLWEPTPEQVTKWKTLYQAVSVDAELNAMIGWLDANPTRRKTKSGISRFVNSWLKRAQDNGGAGLAKPKPDGAVVKTRDMTALDDLTHNFTGCPIMAQSILDKFGQVFHNDGTRTVR